MTILTAYCTMCSFNSTSPSASVDATIHREMTTHFVMVVRGAVPLPRQRWHETATEDTAT